eukprot:COSAG02_NODE_314_length_24915_cov_18.575596_27_plen_1109_part_00
MAYNYVVTAQPPTAVFRSLVGNFTGAADLNLIVAHSTRIELFLLTPEGLVAVSDVGIYGRVATMELIRLPGEDQDSLFISTERHWFCLLGWDPEAKVLTTRANGDLADRIGRKREDGQVALVDPGLRLVGMQLYDGLFKVIPVVPGTGFGEAFNIRMEEIKVIDLALLHCTPEPTLLVLHLDNQDNCHLKTYEVSVRDKDFRAGPWRIDYVDPQSSHVIPVPAPLGGVVLVAEESVTYYLNADTYECQPIDMCEVKTWAYVDPDGSRILVGDSQGFLYMLVLEHTGGVVQNLSWEPLGQSSIASTLSYLDSGVVYVGSAQGDSQLIKLGPERDAETGNLFEIRETYTNLGPIVDFCVVDLDRQGQCQLVTCSGTGKDGSLRQVRNGIGINETAEVELPGIQGLWSLRESSTSLYDKYLVQSFVTETRMLMVSAGADPMHEDGVSGGEAGQGEADQEEGGDLEEGEIAGFDSESRTLLCANLAHDMLLQVTPKEVRLVSCVTQDLTSVWTPGAESEIVIAACSPTQVVVAAEGCRLVYLQLQQQDIEWKLVQVAAVVLEYEVACLCCAPCTVSMDETLLVAVGLWTEISIRLLRLPSLEMATTELLGGGVIPRSVLISAFDGQPMLLCGLGDGQLFTFVLDAETAALTERKKISLGTQPIVLGKFTSNSTEYVFAACDRPTVVYSSNGKLLYSNVNRKDVNHVCPFHCEDFKDHLAISTEDELTIGTVDDIQKLHIRTIPLQEQPKRICHQPQTRVFAVVTMMASDVDPDNYEEVYYLRVYDDQTFEVLDSMELEPYETACSLISTSFTEKEDDASYFVVGTAFCLPGEQEPSKGRILVFQLTEQKKLAKVTELDVPGAVYTMSTFQGGKLVAGVDSKLQIYTWSVVEADGSRVLRRECGHHGHIIVLYIAVRGDFVVVGDLMKSVSLLQYKPPGSDGSSDSVGSIEEVAKDFDANWMTAVSTIDDHTFIGAEHEYNIFTVRRNNDATSDEEKKRLEVVGAFHVGEFINAFRHGSLVMQVPQVPDTLTVAPPIAGGSGDSGSGATAMAVDGPTVGPGGPGADATTDPTMSAAPTLLFATVNGVIGVVAQLPPKQYQRFIKLQVCIQPIG